MSGQLASQCGTSILRPSITTRLKQEKETLEQRLEKINNDEKNQNLTMEGELIWNMFQYT